MKRHIILPVALLATAVGVQGQINSPGNSGYLARGAAMLDDRNYAGCIDQLTALDRTALSRAECEQADWLTALASMHTSHENAGELLRRFVAEYPGSAHRGAALTYLADCILDSDVDEALEISRSVDPAALSPAVQGDYHYHRGYTELMTGATAEAEADFRAAARDSEWRDNAHFYLGYIAYGRHDYATAKKWLRMVNTSAIPGCYADYYLAQIAYVDGDYREALRMARAVLGSSRQTPEYQAEAYRIAGESQYQLGDMREAVDYLSKYAAATSEPAASAMYILGLAQYKSGDWDGAVRSLRIATASDDAMGQSAYLYCGEALVKQGDTSAAIMAFDKASRMDYDADVREAALYNYIVSRFSGASVPFGSSVQAFEDFLTRYPDGKYTAAVQEYLINGYLSDNNYEGALASVNRMSNPSAKVLAAKQQILYALGTRALATDDNRRALDYLDQAYRLGRYDESVKSQTALSLGEAKYKAGKYDEAVLLLNEYLRTAPATDANQALARYDLGYARLAKKDYADAAVNFERFVQNPGNFPDNIIADAYNRLADTYYYRSDWATAADYYDRAYRKYPSAGDYPLFQKAVMEGYRRNHQQKIDALAEMMQEFPTSSLIPDALLETTESQQQLGRRPDAIATYRRLVNLYPNTVQGRRGRLQLALTLLNDGKRGEAIKEYREVISLYPTSEEAAMAVDELKRISADDGTLADFASFLASVDNAPALDVAETDRLTYDAAEKYWLTQGDASRLKSYLSQYPQGAFRAQALGYLMDDAYGREDFGAAAGYAEEIISDYPDHSGAERALAIKAEAAYAAGDASGARAAWDKLLDRASSPQNILAARTGQMRIARDMSEPAAMTEAAEAILASSAAGASARNEAIFTMGLASELSGKDADARTAWTRIADETDDLYGAKAAVYLAQSLYEDKEYKNARARVEKFIDAATPHTYWLARGFILLSDIYKAEGKTFEAREYLRSLRENYPGTESDIIEMIDTRLSALK